MRADPRGRQRRCLRARAGARRIEHHRIEPAELGGRQRGAVEIARLGRDAAAESGRARRAGQRRQHVRLRVDRMHPAARGGERQAEGAAAGEQIGHRRRLADRLAHRGANLRFGLDARLQEGAGRQRDRARPRTSPWTGRRCTITSGSAMPSLPGHAREILVLRQRRDALAIGKAGRAGAQQHDVEPGIGGRDQHLAATGGERQVGQRLAQGRQEALRSRASTIAQAATSTMSWPARARKPSVTRPPRRSNASRARRRIAGGIGCGGSIGDASRPRRASAAATCSHRQAASAAGSRCCSWQPPQTPKCGQRGAARGACRCQTSGSAAKPPSRGAARRTVRRSPGRVSGTNSRRSPRRAMPSPRAPIASIVTSRSPPCGSPGGSCLRGRRLTLAGSSGAG